MSPKPHAAPANPVLVRGTDLGAIHLKDFSFEGGEYGIANASAVRRYRAVARKLEPGEALNAQQAITWSEEVLVCASLFLVFGSFLWVPVIIISSFLLFSVRWILAACAFLLLSSLALPRKMDPPLRFPAWLRQSMYRYFSLTMVMPGEDKVDKKRSYIFAGAPHGVIPLGDFLSFQLAPLGYIIGLGAPAVLNLPWIGHMLSCMGIVSCAKKCASKNLASGRSLGVMPGGIAEIFELSPNREAAYLLRRKGFVKLALENGAALVPCYTLGNSEVYDALTSTWLQALSKRFRASLTLFWGRLWLPIPYRRPLCLLMADPIDVPKIENPTQEDVDKWHSVFCDEMKALFDTHKAAYGWSHKELVFV